MKITHAQKIAVTVAAALGLAGGSAVYAASSDTQTVNFTINSISEIDVANSAVTLTVGSATAGSNPTPATATSSYSITTTASTNGKKITAALDTAMPTNVTLQVAVDAPTGSGTSQGTVTLSATPVDVVTALQGVAQTNVSINYTLGATLAALPTSSLRTVTYTIVDL